MAGMNFSNTIDTIKGQFRNTTVKVGDGDYARDPSLPAAKIGALTTRTSDTVGTLTMNAGHGLVAANRLDLYWMNADGTRGSRYGIVVGAVAVDEVPITGGAGDILPLDETAITAMVPVLEEFIVTAGNVIGLVVGCDQPAVAVFLDNAAAVVLVVQIDGSTDAYSWNEDSPVATPLGADVTDVYLSHGGTSAARVNAVALLS